MTNHPVGELGKSRPISMNHELLMIFYSFTKLWKIYQYWKVGNKWIAKIYITECSAPYTDIADWLSIGVIFLLWRPAMNQRTLFRLQKGYDIKFVFYLVYCGVDFCSTSSSLYIVRVTCSNISNRLPIENSVSKSTCFENSYSLTIPTKRWQSNFSRIIAYYFFRWCIFLYFEPSTM